MHRGLMFFLLTFVLLSSGCAKVVEDGEAGVKFVLGKISEQPLPSGLKFFVPFITKIETWNVKTMQLKEEARVPSSEGLITGLDVSLLFRVPIENVVRVRRTIGRNYIDVVVVPNLRESMRSVVSGYQVKALYSEVGRDEITHKITERLIEKLTPKGIIVEDVLLRDVALPPSFATSIEAKLKAEQESLQKEFELVKANKDAEIEIARAKGVSKSNEIIATSLSENYLRYLWIQGLHNKSSAEVIYVPTEANLPILESTRNLQRKLDQDK